MSESDGGGNVTDINDAKRAKKKRGETFSPHELKQGIAMKMWRSPLAPRKWADFPRRFHVVRDGAGRPTILEELPGKVVRYVISATVVEAIRSYCAVQLAAVEGAGLTHPAADDCFKLWLSQVPPLEIPPASVAELSEPVLTYRRFDFDAPVVRDASIPPNFASLTARWTKQDAVVAFLGSLFFREADRQQYLFLYGQGNDGKGALLRFLKRLFGDAYQTLGVKTPADRFWDMKHFGKRIAGFVDLDDSSFLKSGAFKSLVGNDPVYFEEKGLMGFTAIPTCKVIIASNWKPNVSGSRSDLRRLIYSELPGVDIETSDKDTSFESRLWDERKEIVTYCKSMYAEMCPNHSRIPCALAGDIGRENDADDAALFSKYFLATPNARTKADIVSRALSESGIRSNQEKKRLKEVWSRLFNISFVHEQDANYYEGMELRPLVSDALS